MLALLDAWHRHGGSRLDRTDPSGIGKITDPGAAIMDTAWPMLANAWASSVLGAKLSAELSTFVSQFDQPPGGQYTGWHIYMDKDLRTILGEHGTRQVRRPLLRRRQPQALPRRAVVGDRPGRQRAHQVPGLRTRRLGAPSATAERITFVPGLLPLTMRYTNRPSGIQQVLSFGGHAPGDTGK